jgi:hypothetical protein
VSSSRKLLIAALLVAGGYAAAFLVGRGSDLVLPPSDSETNSASENRWFAALRGAVTGDDNSATVGKLVPETTGDTSHSRGSLATVPRQPDAPIWLTATTEPSAAVAVATQPESAQAPVLSFAEPPPPLPALPAQPRLDASPATPQARITNVVAADREPSRREASPWDRWPRWNSDDVASAKGPVAATFQESSNSAGMVPVTYSAAVVARNTPARDHGLEAAPIGRTHVVVDGDSLQKLAERYLDDPTRDGEIYRLNRDVLSSPELLPIGVELQIPDDQLADANLSRTASNMVPVEWTPRPFEDPPRAELLAPIPANRSD